MEPIRVFMENGKKAVLCCPFCNIYKHEPSEQFLSGERVRDILCSCGKTYQIQIEFRKHYRKKTLFNGTCSNAGASDKITVTNLSIGGCGFELVSTKKPREGDRIRLTFSLDDPVGTIIREEAIVTSVRDRYVGCKFHGLNSASRADIAFYLKTRSAGKS